MDYPRNENTENLLLASMMNSINVANDAAFALTVEDFYSSRNRAVFMALCQCVKRDEKIEVLNVFHALKAISQQEADLPFLMDLWTAGSSYGGTSKAFIEEIKKFSKLRKIVTMCQKAIELSCKDGSDPIEVQGTIFKEINEALSSSGKKTSFRPQEILENFDDSGKTLVELIEQRQEEFRNGICTMKGIPLGYEKLDEMMNGICKGHFIIIGARPGVGKTSFMCNWIHRMIKFRNQKVVFFSLEMTEYEVIQKLISIDSGVDLKELLKGKTSGEFQKVVTSQFEYFKHNLIIEVEDALTVSQLIARANRLIASDGVTVVYIDYLTRIRGDGKFESKHEEISSISNALTAFAKHSKIPVICVAQLNRDMEKGESVRAPRSSDLGGSGQIERDAHDILLLHRPDQFDKLNKPGMLEVHVTKNRFGADQMVSFACDYKCSRYEEVNFEKKTQFDDEIDDKFKQFGNYK